MQKSPLLLAIGLLAAFTACSEKPAPYVIHKSSDQAADKGQGDATLGDDEEITSGGTVEDEEEEEEETTTKPTSGTGTTKDPVDTAAQEALAKAALIKEYVTAAMKKIDGFRWEMACDKDPGTEQVCDSTAAVKKVETLPELAGLSFSVELRFRGVVEPMKYKDGKLTGERFYTAGVADDPTYNIYSIEVSNPKQIYYLNYANAVGHDTFLLDYTAKIEVAAGATITLTGNGQNGRQIANFKKLVAPGVPAPSHISAQFVQMNVVSVTPVGGLPILP